MCAKEGSATCCGNGRVQSSSMNAQSQTRYGDKSIFGPILTSNRSMHNSWTLQATLRTSFAASASTHLAPQQEYLTKSLSIYSDVYITCHLSIMHAVT